MIGRKTPSPPEDPAVGPVEALLSRTAAFRETTYPSQSSRLVSTTHALWLCACVTMDDAPAWLIYDDADHGVVWCRIPDGADVSDVVDAESIAGGHTDPAGVLEWLKGEAPEPWTGGDGWDDGGVLDRFSRTLVRP